MAETSAKERAADLRDRLRKYDYHYYVLNDPLVTDAEYDECFRELVRLEEEHPDLRTPDSPTQRVGSDLDSDFEKVEHPRPVLSLANAFNEDDLHDWETRNRKRLDNPPDFEYVLEPKLDGLSVVLTYENAAAGSLKQKDSRITAERPLTAYLYDVMDSSDDVQLDTEEDALHYLKKMGFQVVPEYAHYPALSHIIPHQQPVIPHYPAFISTYPALSRVIPQESVSLRRRHARPDRAPFRLIRWTDRTGRAPALRLTLRLPCSWILRRRTPRNASSSDSAARSGRSSGTSRAGGSRARSSRPGRCS